MNAGLGYMRAYLKKAERKVKFSLIIIKFNNLRARRRRFVREGGEMGDAQRQRYIFSRSRWDLRTCAF